ncbi:hypothetical protein L905_16390 [Agrobacterium sp. TS43]|nr:hypothetical protein L906_18930 [Agrobacterium sp. TS45]KVK67195.1 hypothetical protein L907_18910 [Agrobacterium sp. C13]KVK67605.1 hypothetical protein L905_16390 [Agrobacterium sp. TS43]
MFIGNNRFSKGKIADVPSYSHIASRGTADLL